MTQKIILISIIVSLLIIAVGCDQPLSEQEIKEKLIEANRGLEKYSLDMFADTQIDAEFDENEMNESNIQSAKNLASILSTEYSRKIYAQIDREYEILKINMETSRDSKGNGSKTILDSEIYVKGNDMYTKTFGSWMKTTSEKDIWNQYDDLDETIKLIESGKIELLEDETIGEKSYYVARIEPDLDIIGEILMENILVNSGNSSKWGDYVKSYTFTIWIKKENFLIEKVESDMIMEITTENMGIRALGDVKITVLSSASSEIAKLEADTEIKAPEGMDEAKDYTGMLGNIGGSEDPENSITGNTISAVLS